MESDLSSIIFGFLQEIHQKENKRRLLRVAVFFTTYGVVCHKHDRRLIREYFPGIGHLHHTPSVCIYDNISIWKILSISLTVSE